ncbi:unnamed protein product [Prorocentrum cordatum]|uniref:Cytidine deaminase n=1 Tax=Prorocentrum cordatum TaxID=2364126 RepID=A0ABN9XCR7_9DINO|nr:unnamed protein product [Polarella glacialis]
MPDLTLPRSSMRPALAAAAAAASSAASPAAPPGTELSKRSRPRSPPGAAPPAGAACGAGAREAAEAPAAGPELPPPPEPPREGRRRRLNVTSSLSSPRFSPLGSPLDGPLLFAQSPVLVPRSPADVDAADWWTPQLLPQDSPLRFALDELRRYMQDWERAETDDVREGFWHRKSGKAVLSVVICRSKDDGASVAYRGMNAEVSLPAGSLCAERAAIGRAASSFERASDILVVATADPQDKLNPLWPCEVCQSWLAKLRTQNPEISVLAVESISSRRVRCSGERQAKAPASARAAYQYAAAGPVEGPRGSGGGHSRDAVGLERYSLCRWLVGVHAQRSPAHTEGSPHAVHALAGRRPLRRGPRGRVQVDARRLRVPTAAGPAQPI